MQSLVQIQSGDRRLLSELSSVMAEAARRSGAWLACRAGCTECCIGAFGITQIDALRLRQGLEDLDAADPERAAAVRLRAEAYVKTTASAFPGDPTTGLLTDEDLLPPSMDEIPCPALDPDTGCCDLYAARPITCRTFGPATRAAEKTLVACELCYVGATDEQIAVCAVQVDPDGLEAGLLAELAAQGVRGMTLVGYALAPSVSLPLKDCGSDHRVSP